MMSSRATRAFAGLIFTIIALLILIAANGTPANGRRDDSTIHVDDAPAYACIDLVNPAACEDMP